MKKILSILLAVVMTASIITVFVACSKTTNEETTNPTDTSANADSDLAYIQEKGTLIVGMTEYAPMNYKEKGSDEWTGFDTELAQALGKELGVDVQFVVIDWDNKFIELDAKSIDCIWNGMTITDEVKQNSNVTNAYVKNAQVVVMNKDAQPQTAVSSLEDIKDLKFTAEAGSAGESAIKEASIKNYTAVAAQSDALMEVQSGSADACVIDLTMANAMTGAGTSYSNLTQVAKLNEEEYGIAFRKGSDMVAKTNEFMQGMKDDGGLQTLANKYELTLA